MKRKYKVECMLGRVLYERDMTQAELGRRIGSKHGFINRIVNNKGNPTITTILRITNVLGCEVEDIFQGGEVDESEIL